MVKIRHCLAVGIALFALLCGLLPAAGVAYAADGQALGGDGTYSVPVTLDLKMGADQFTNPVTVEKQDGRYYLTFGYSASVGYLKLNLEGMEVGTVREQKDGWTYDTYTLSPEHLRGTLSFSAYINAMSREMDFTATLKLSAASKTSDAIRDLGERPAEFVPVIATNAAADYALPVGSVFPIPAATARLGDSDCPVTVTVTFESEPVDAVGGKLTLDRAGNYRIVYRAADPRYQTSLGNDSYTETVITVHAVSGESTLVKFRDAGHVLPDAATLLAGKMAEDSDIYQKAAAAMKTLADRFEVFSAEFIGADGEEIPLNGKLELLFRADDSFDRTKAAVYRMDADGSLTRLSARGYGRYMIAETNRTGTFIVCVPGVAFRMPMWGYALILAGVLILVTGAVLTVRIIIKRKRKTTGSK